MEKEYLQFLIKTALNDVDKVIEYAEDKEFINSQEFLDFLDELNELSVRY